LLPENFAVILVGDPSSGMFEFCSYLAATHLSADERLVFVESNTSTMRVRDRLLSFGIDSVEYEDKGTLAFVDMHTPTDVVENDTKAIRADDLSNLELIIEKVEEAIVKVGGHPVVVLFDSVTPLYMYNDSSEVGKFFHALSSMIKVSGKLTATVHQNIVPEEQIALLSTIADGVLEMKVDESFHRFVRIKRFTGLTVSPKWVPIEFEETEEDESAVLNWRSG
jgi:KaiC/GvpD/RAD55 family RecA-like ATPase